MNNPLYFFLHRDKSPDCDTYDKAIYSFYLSMTKEQRLYLQNTLNKNNPVYPYSTFSFIFHMIKLYLNNLNSFCIDKNIFDKLT